MKRQQVIVNIPSQPDETISQSESSRKPPLVEAKARGVHPDVALAEDFPEQRSEIQKWHDFEVAAKQCVELSKTDPKLINHDALAVTLMAILAILRGSLKRGEPGGIQNAVMAADLMASEIERAFELQPEKLRKVTEKLPRIAVLISPGAVADDNPERKRVRKYLAELGVGTRSNPPTATKICTGTVWTGLAEMLLEDITMMQSALSYRSQGNAFLDSLVAPHGDRAKAYKDRLDKLPPLSEDTFAPWWEIAKELLLNFWDANPVEAEAVIKIAEADEGCKRQQKKAHSFAVGKVYHRFLALARAKGQAKTD